MYYRLQDHNVHTDDVVAFVRQLHGQLGRPIILCLDRYSVHRSAIKQLLASGVKWLMVEWLPPYAPELNPTEQCWNRSKNVQLPNFIPDDLLHLKSEVRKAFIQQRSQQSVLASFFKIARLKL